MIANDRRVAGWLAILLPLAVAAVHARALSGDRARAAALRRSRPVGRPLLSAHPRVSVLVAAWNEEARVADHIRSVRGLSYPDVEYILCAGGTDATFERAEAALEGWGTLLVQRPGEGKQRALRRCLERATGSVVFLTDADCLLDDESFERTLAPITAGAGAATGRSRPLDAETTDPGVLCRWAPPYVVESAAPDISHGMLGRNCAVRREALRAAGDFDADVPTGTDFHLARALARAGVPTAFARWSFVRTTSRLAMISYLRQQSRWLRNHWIQGRRASERAPQVHALRTWGVGVALAAMPLAAIAVPMVGALWVALVAHGWLSRLRYVHFTCRVEGITPPRGIAVSALLWFAVDAAAWVRSLAEALIPGRRNRW